MSTNDTIVEENESTTYLWKFALLLSFEIPSIILSLIIFWHFFTCRRARTTDHQHAIIVLLVFNFLQVLGDIPISIDFYHFGGNIRLFTSGFCTWWTWYDFSLFTINGFLMAWITIERYLFIFHDQIIRHRIVWKRRLIRISPLIFSIFWPSFFYLLSVVISPICTNTFSSTSLYCGTPCYFLTGLGLFDVLFNVVLPVIIILSVNIFLVVRVIYQRMNFAGCRQINWRNEGKMIIQLAIISLIYLSVWTPFSVAQFGQSCIDSEFLLEQYDTINFMVNLVPLVLPLACLPLVPKLVTRIKNMTVRRNRIEVLPATLILRPGLNPPNMLTTLYAANM